MQRMECEAPKKGRGQRPPKKAQARLPEYPWHLKKLSELELPAELRALVQKELERLAERRRRRKERREIEAGP